MEKANKRSRAVVFLLAFLCILISTGQPVPAAPAWPSDTGIQAEAGIAMDENSGAVLFGQNIHVAYPPASITKLLTALVAAEHASLDENVTFSHDAVYDVEAGSGNSLSLEEGDVLTVRDCLHALLLRSSNQAANALAEHVAGSREGFAAMMNEKIAEIGCTESHFANPSGLNDEEQYVTAYDMALIARAAFANETVLAAGSARTYELPATINNPEGLTIAMEHKILTAKDPSSRYYVEGAVAGKTGYTSMAGNTLVTYAVRDGRGVISVILKGTQPQYYIDGKTLIEFGFASFQNIRAAEQEKYLSEQEGIEKDGDFYQASELYLEEDACVTLPLGASFSDLTRTVDMELTADHPKTALARLIYTYQNRQVGSVYICARNLHFSTEPVPVSLLETGNAAGAEGAGKGEDAVSGQEDSAEWGEGAVSGQEEQAKRGEGAVSRQERTAPAIRAPVLFVLLLAAAVCCTAFLLWRRQKKEREAQALRRARRRQRIREMGYSEEEIDRMVNERMLSAGGRQDKGRDKSIKSKKSTGRTEDFVRK